MGDEQDAPLLASKPDQFERARASCGHWLLAQDMESAFEACAGVFVMKGMW
jgi:hypothetical protein